MYFLRSTLDPEGDLRRGFSGVYGAWVDTEEEIADAIAECYPDGADHLPPPRQDPVTGMWCWEPEAGLSAFAFHDEESFLKAVERIQTYGSHLSHLAVFESEDWDAGKGADSEDVFRSGRFLGWVPLKARWDDFLNMETASKEQVLAPTF